MNELPPEVLTSIFELALPHYRCDPYDPCYLNHTSQTIRAALTLSLVCNYFRLVAYGSPALWSVIEVKRAIPLAQTHTWLERAKGVALDVILLIDHRSSSRPSFLAALAALAERRDQWRSLFIHGISISDSFCKLLLPSSLPHLETVVLSDSNQCPTTPFVSTPRLHTLDVFGIPIFFVHCTMLRQLTLDTPYGLGTWKKCTEFIASCDTLQTLRLRNPELGNLLDMDGRIQKIESHSLKELELFGCSEATASVVLRHTVSSSVTKLVIGSINRMCTSTLSPHPNTLTGIPGLEAICIMPSGLEYVCRLIRAVEASDRGAHSVDGKARSTRRPLKVQIRCNQAVPLGATMGERIAYVGNIKFLEERCILESSGTSPNPRLVLNATSKVR
ncbi:hypothetical protein FRB97_006607 [Tulasnella sp. 331]|nr:hypothetical protein FRB97_006607 [Tulasnella sp. 331]KAG8877432.1 hypothetical protein FRB98_006690 [Tulasnella sp. 332]